MNIKEIRELYQQITERMAHVRSELEHKMMSTPPLDGVRRISREGPSAYCVPLSAVFETPTLILAPSYYIQDIQNEAVCNYIFKDGLTLEQMLKRLSSTIDTKSVAYKGETITLNPHTIAALETLLEEIEDAE